MIRRTSTRWLRSTTALLLVAGAAIAGGEGEPRGASPTPTARQRLMLDAIRHVESGGLDPVPDGDGGRAIGPYQIHRAYWTDAHAFDPTLGGSYQDCRKRHYAERVVAAYMRRYARAAWAAGDAQTIARIHNGGPRGHKKNATKGYWRRVQARLRELNAATTTARRTSGRRDR